MLKMDHHMLTICILFFILDINGLKGLFNKIIVISKSKESEK
jgi:hypothetical protein